MPFNIINQVVGKLKNQKGVTLVEIVISIAVLGIIAAAVTSYFTWSLGVFKHTDVRSTEESIARSEMEVIKRLPYIESTTSYATGTSYQGYNVTNTVTPTISGTSGLQKISITVARSDTMVGAQSLTITGYKLDR